MSVYKTPRSPYWQYDFQFRGRRFYGSTRKKEKRAAEREEARIRTAIEAGGGNSRKPMTLNEASHRYYEEVGKHLASEKTVDYQLENLNARLGKLTLLSEIDDDALARYVATRRTEVKPASVNREIELLRRMMRRAERLWRADLGDMPRWTELLLHEPEERVRELTEKEEATLLDQLRADIRPMIEFALLSGMRLQNVIRLTWADVDYDAGVIRIRVKSRSPERKLHLVPLTHAMKLLLAGAKGQHAIYCFTYLCRKDRGTRKRGQRYPFSATGWRRIWKRALKAAGIKDFRFHDLRHTRATRVLRAVGNLKTVQKMLGHASITTTAKYGHVLIDDVRAAMEAAESRKNPGIAQGEAAGMTSNPRNKQAK